MFERCARRQPETSIAFGFVTFKPYDTVFKWCQLDHVLWDDHYGELHSRAMMVVEDVYSTTPPA